MSILLGIGIFFLGLIIGYGLHFLAISMQSYSGTMRIRKSEDKTIFSLELDEAPEMLVDKPLVIFKIDTDLSGRE
jgi:ABC-type antimicrobial peptide transport system permease subunit